MRRYDRHFEKRLTREEEKDLRGIRELTRWISQQQLTPDTDLFSAMKALDAPVELYNTLSAHRELFGFVVDDSKTNSEYWDLSVEDNDAKQIRLQMFDWILTHNATFCQLMVYAVEHRFYRWLPMICAHPGAIVDFIHISRKQAQEHGR